MSRDAPSTHEGRGDNPAPLVHFAPGQYPSDLETHVVVRSGSKLPLRPIRPDDASKLIEFHRRLSPDSIYRRYFSEHPTLSPSEVRHLTTLDYVDRMALVIEDGDELIAVGRYDRYPNSSEAEVAFIVRDDFQHSGLGLRLLDVLAEAAWDRGIKTFTAETQVSNGDMLSVFLRSGFPVTTSVGGAEISARFPIAPLHASRRGADHDRAEAL
ncbi:MAG TPA: GNAT family N-acetyltransferase [Acidimicrobiales bacterium]|nr:GNAT family N-acetyltransferase [Acidimicrobiales bacterium]